VVVVPVEQFEVVHAGAAETAVGELEGDGPDDVEAGAVGGTDAADAADVLRDARLDEYHLGAVGLSHRPGGLPS
jgi:hypothetical protein